MPRPKAEKRKVVTTMRLDAGLLKKLKSHALREGRSRSNLVEKMLSDGLAKRDRAVAAERVDVLG